MYVDVCSQGLPAQQAVYDSSNSAIAGFQTKGEKKSLTVENMNIRFETLVEVLSNSPAEFFLGNISIFSRMAVLTILE